MPLADERPRATAERERRAARREQARAAKQSRTARYKAEKARYEEEEARAASTTVPLSVAVGGETAKAMTVPAGTTYAQLPV